MMDVPGNVMSATNRTCQRTRRDFLRAAWAACCLASTGCGQHIARKRFPGSLTDFTPNNDLPLPTFQIGETGPGIVVLHELPGLTKDDLAFARGLSRHGFRVYAPVLFGKPEQGDSPLDLARGFRDACGGKRLFNCSDLSARSPILDKLAPLCDEVRRMTGDSIGAIGMCLTGILPLALLQNGVDAAVVCQPTLPFSASLRKPDKDQAPDLGLGESDLANARMSLVPFMLVHYAHDELCPPARVETIRDTFKARVATIDLPGGHHSSLGSDFDDTAFEDVVTYLKVRLEIEKGPRAMKAAKLGGSSCRIGENRTWEAM